MTTRGEEGNEGEPVLVSIHDCMPETMGLVEALLERLRRAALAPVTILVVPGRNWDEAGLARLRAWAEEGHELAAHGWRHETRPRRLYHRLHAALLSRNVAEHLDLDSAGVLELLHRSRDWFASVDLPTPELYVPPAWALGPIGRDDLEKAPFPMIETTRGLLFPREKGGPVFRSLPLVGFEADTALREGFLRRWNRFQWTRAARTGRPLRLSLHPHDPELRLRDQLEDVLDRAGRSLGYREMASRG